MLALCFCSARICASLCFPLCAFARVTGSPPRGGSDLCPPTLPSAVVFVLCSTPLGSDLHAQCLVVRPKYSNFAGLLPPAGWGGNHAYNCPECSEAISLNLEQYNVQNSKAVFRFVVRALFVLSFCCLFRVHRQIKGMMPMSIYCQFTYV